MYHIISVVLKNPDVLIESDPLEQILEYWKAEGTLTHIILSPVNIQNIKEYYSYPCTVGFHENEQAVNSESDNSEAATSHSEIINPSDTGLPLLFDIPQNIATVQTQLNAYRLLLTFFAGTKQQIDTLLDTTEEIVCKNMSSGSELMFAMPISHLKGLDSLIKTANN